MNKAVTAIITTSDKVFSITRQKKLRTFPGYTAFPGGKIDPSDQLTENVTYRNLERALSSPVDPKLLNALQREILEGLGHNLSEAVDKGQVIFIKKIQVATTPEFNPYRFETHFFQIHLDSQVEFKLDVKRIAWGDWCLPSEWIEKYDKTEIILGPVIKQLYQALNASRDLANFSNINFPSLFDLDGTVPMIEPVHGLKQLLPHSKTFPPIRRTNSFLFGDRDARRILVDPSPRDDAEFLKFKLALKDEIIDAIFITHHHPDHHEFAPDLARQWKLPIIMGVITHGLLLKKYGKNYLDQIEIEIVAEGDRISVSLGHDVLIMEVPGHDEGQLALYPASKSWFLASDLFQTIGTVVVGGDEGNMGKYYSSLEKVIKLDPKFIFPSHGIGVGGTDKLQKTLVHRKRREADIKVLLDKGYSKDSILKCVYSNLEERLIPYALATIEAHIKNIQAN